VTAHAVSPVSSEVDNPPAASPRPRLWLPLTLIALYWAYVAVSTAIDMPTFTRFMSQSAALLVVMLVFITWWVFNRRVARRDRLLVLVAAVASVVLGQWLSHKSLGPLPVMYGLPILFTAWCVWLLIARRAAHRLWRGGLIAVLLLSMGVFALFRGEGLKGAGAADLRWRWSATAEERYLAQRSAPAAPPSTQAAALTLRAGDWPGFRGPHRDSVVRGVSTRTDWQT
jgi:outer membrane protein assembly factor BamB